jgi:hypothetical protein
MVDRSDPYRPKSTIRSPSGRFLTVEYDRFRDHWRVTPGEYVRMRLADALVQATGTRPDSDWVGRADREISTDLGTL